MSDDLEAVFSELRERMIRSSPGMNIAEDRPGNLVLKTSWIEPGKKEPAWFAAVQLKKTYVSWHLMPLYALPDLGRDLPPDLERRRQGKSCFNFKKVEADLIEPLEQLTTRCALAYRDPVTAKPH